MSLTDSVSNTGDKQDYVVSACVPADLSSTELDRCVALVTTGGAVTVGFAQAELPRASVLAIVRHESEIIGVGSIKRIRDYYTAGIASAQKSGFSFDKNMPEVGYIAVDDRHRRRGLSHRILEQLLATKDGPLFATTDEVRMKKILTGHGFAMKGMEWEGDRGRLSLWIRE